MEDTKNFAKNQRVVTFLNRQEVDFLDKLGKDALFSTGLKLSRTKVIAWLVELMKSLNINGEGIKSERDFENRVKEILGAKFKRGQFLPVTEAKQKRRRAMKNALINKSLMVLLIFLSLVGLAIADDNFSIPVSCSIPAVPGLNAPPLTPNAEETGSSSKQDIEIKAAQDDSVIQEDSEEQIVLADGNAAGVTTTIYSR